jgi:LppP/LprE lipoprotein
MPERLKTATCAALLAAGGALLAGCGSSTKVVTKSSPPTPIATGPSGSTGTSEATARTGASGAGAAGAGQAGEGAGTATTRTAAQPGFVHEESSSAQLAAAIAVLKEHGYSPNDASQYHASQTLRVLVGTATPSGDGYQQQAFFFVGGRYIGTDTNEPSASIAVVGQGDAEVTLAYARYHPGDALCCAHGGQAQVRFALNNGALVPLDPIPPQSVRR